MTQPKLVLKARDLTTYDSFIMAGTVYEIKFVTSTDGGRTFNITAVPSDGSDGLNGTYIKVDAHREFELVTNIFSLRKDS